jgi:hypothetical protein
MSAKQLQRLHQSDERAKANKKSPATLLKYHTGRRGAASRKQPLFQEAGYKLSYVKGRFRETNGENGPSPLPPKYYFSSLMLPKMVSYPNE